MRTSRRAFLGGTFLAAAGIPAVADRPSPGELVEPERRLKVRSDCDILVAGGGPAGIATAVSAARAGAKVRLLELRGSLGGIWTSGLLGCLIDFGRGSVAQEINRRLDAWGARAADIYEPDYMRAVCEEMCREAGVQFQLDTRVVAAYRDPSGRNISAVVTESKSGREAWSAGTYVDATGDGDLAALAGCGFDIGVTEDGRDQPASMMAVLSTPDADKLRPCLQHCGCSWAEATANFGKEIARAGLTPSYGHPTLYRLSRNLLLMMANHEYGVKIDDAAAITAATVHARRENLDLVAALAKLGGPWEGLRVAATAEQLGHRTARRIHGRCTVTRDDVVAGSRFEDAVGESRFCVDIHALTKDAPAVTTLGVKARPFQIPLRALRAKDLDNLYMAGRCISGDAIAQASYRVVGPAVQMGESLGRHLAHAVNRDG